MSKSKFTTKRLIYIVTLAAISIVLGLIEIPWGIFVPQASFLKLDFSEVAILIALILVGTSDTFFVILLRAVARRLVIGMGPDQWLGEFLAILASLSLMLGYVILSKILNKKEEPIINGNDVNLDVSLKEWMIGPVLLTLLLTTILFTVNLFFATPLYYSLFGDTTWTFAGIMNGESMFFPNPADYINFTVIAYIPFNLIKGALVTCIFFGLKPYLKALKF